MSEQIKITLVIKNKKNDADNCIKNTNEAEAGKNSLEEVNMLHNICYDIMSTLIKEGIVSESFCGGRGLCKRCRIQFMSPAPLPTVIERNIFSPEELRQGYRLACMAKPRNDCTIRLDFVKSKKIDIIAWAADIKTGKGSHVQAELSYAANNIESEVAVLENTKQEIVESENSNQEIIESENIKRKVAETENIESEISVSAHIDQNSQQNCIIAVDLGTTTIAMQLVKIENGQVVDTYCAMNPQRSYGADVLSRIQAANTGHADIMQESVWKIIYAGINRFTNKAQETHLKICCMCIAGNTTMEHLLMGLSTQNLGQSPFMPVELGLQKCTITVNAADKNAAATVQNIIEYKLPVYITPGISAFVGGDIAAGLYHCNLLGISPAKQQNCTVPNAALLFIDLGTNGEMAIVSGDRIIVTATAAGPAFEGGAGAAAPGSDMVKAAASLLDKGIIDETGLMTEPYFSEGIDIDMDIDIDTAIDTDTMQLIQGGSSRIDKFDIIHLTQTDIRSLQMAKAAVRAGIDILCAKIENCQISKVYLAGGFGYYLDVDSAIKIGLLPENLKSCTKALGNTSLAGAFDMGKDLWSGKLNEDELAARLRQVESINLAKEDEFNKLYLSYINFPMKNN